MRKSIFYNLLLLLIFINSCKDKEEVTPTIRPDPDPKIEEREFPVSSTEESGKIILPDGVNLNLEPYMVVSTIDTARFYGKRYKIHTIEGSQEQLYFVSNANDEVLFLTNSLLKEETLDFSAENTAISLFLISNEFTGLPVDEKAKYIKKIMSSDLYKEVLSFVVDKVVKGRKDLLSADIIPILENISDYLSNNVTRRLSSHDHDKLPIHFINYDRENLLMNKNPLKFTYVGGLYHKSDVDNSKKLGKFLINKGFYDKKYLLTYEWYVDMLSDYFPGLKTDMTDVTKEGIRINHADSDIVMSGQYKFRFASGNVAYNKDEVTSMAIMRNGAIKNKMMVDFILGIDMEEFIKSLKGAGCHDEVMKQLILITEKAEEAEKDNQYSTFLAHTWDLLKIMESCLPDLKTKLTLLYKLTKIVGRIELAKDFSSMLAEEEMQPYEIYSMMNILTKNEEASPGWFHPLVFQFINEQQEEWINPMKGEKDTNYPKLLQFKLEENVYYVSNSYFPPKYSLDTIRMYEKNEDLDGFEVKYEVSKGGGYVYNEDHPTNKKSVLVTTTNEKGLSVVTWNLGDAEKQTLEVKASASSKDTDIFDPVKYLEVQADDGIECLAEDLPANWWEDLETPLKVHFNSMVGNGPIAKKPSSEQIKKLFCETTTLDIKNLGVRNVSIIKYFKNLVSLIISDNNISSLDISNLSKLERVGVSETLNHVRLSGCTSLTGLSIHNSLITDLDLSGLSNLKSLTIKDSKRLTSLDVSGLINLEELRCNYNPLLTSINAYGLSNLSRLDFYNSKVSSLDISGCTNLTYIEGSNNPLNSLDVSNFTKLKVLKIGVDNKLRSLNVKGCTSLELLHIRGALEDLNTSGLTNLKELELWGSSIKSLDVSGCSSLLKLDVSGGVMFDGVPFGGQLTSLNVAGCKSLKSLLCSGNKLTFLDVSGLSSLEWLLAKNNKLSTLDISGANSLVVLDCGDNLLTSLDISNLTNLETLICQKNSIKSLDASGNSKINTIICSENDLISLDVSNLKRLKRLTCDNNHSLTSLNMSGCTNLASLYINRNTSLESIDATNCSSLGSLSCGDFQLTSLKVSGCTSLEWLYAGENKLTSLDVSGLSKLGYLGVPNNKSLTSLNVSGCKNLEVLDCYRTQINTLDVSGFSKLFELNVNENQLESLNISGCISLETLNCDKNQIKSLDASGLARLVELEAGYNQLQSLKVSGCTSLETLRCMGNKLSSLEVSGLPNLWKIDCSHNQLSSTSLTLTSLPSLSFLNCEYNQLSSLDMNGFPKLKTLICSNNQLNSLEVSNCTNLQHVDCEQNQMTYSSLEALILNALGKFALNWSCDNASSINGPDPDNPFEDSDCHKLQILHKN